MQSRNMEEDMAEKYETHLERDYLKRSTRVFTL